jgi:hypothetical protein
LSHKSLFFESDSGVHHQLLVHWIHRQVFQRNYLIIFHHAIICFFLSFNISGHYLFHRYLIKLNLYFGKTDVLSRLLFLIFCLEPKVDWNWHKTFIWQMRGKTHSAFDRHRLRYWEVNFHRVLSFINSTYSFDLIINLLSRYYFFDL